MFFFVNSGIYLLNRFNFFEWVMIMDSFIKIAVIGGGSSYTPELIEGIINRNAVLKVNEIALVDIPTAAEKLTIIKELVDRMVRKSGLDIRVIDTFDRQKALEGCSYVITQFRHGGLAGRVLDERIPLKYNVVGQETTGPGGFSLALRTIPVILSIAKDMEKLCPNAWLINFTNPSGIITEAVNKYSKVKCVGLCNVPINMERDLAGLFNVEPEKIYCEFIGLNHLSWIKKVFVCGEDVTDKLFSMDLSNRNIVANITGVPESSDIIKNIRLIPSPYLNYFYFQRHMLEEELESVRSGKGTRAECVKEVEKDLFDIYKNPGLDTKPEQLAQRGGSLYSEAAVSLIQSIHTDSGAIHVVNVPNRGAITDLNMDSVIETNCVVKSSGIYPIASGKLPEVVMPLVASVKTYERLTIEAAVTGSRERALQALICHPLIHGVDAAAGLLADILEAHKNYLGTFFEEGVAN